MQAVDIDKVSGDYAGLPLDLAYELVQQHMKKYVRIIGVGTPYNKWKTPGQNCSRKDGRHTMTIDSLIKDRTIFPTIVVPSGENMGTEHDFVWLMI